VSGRDLTTALIEALDRADPHWRLEYECNPFAAAADMGVDPEEFPELCLDDEDALWARADEFEQQMRQDWEEEQ